MRMRYFFDAVLNLTPTAKLVTEYVASYTDLLDKSVFACSCRFFSRSPPVFQLSPLLYRPLVEFYIFSDAGFRARGNSTPLYM